MARCHLPRLDLPIWQTLATIKNTTTKIYNIIDYSSSAMVYSTCRCLSDCGSSMTPSVPAPHPKWLGKSIHLATQGLLNHFSGHKKPIPRHQNDFMFFPFREQANLFYEMAFDGLFFGRLDYREKDQRLLAKRGEMLWQTTSKGKFQLKEGTFDGG